MSEKIIETKNGLYGQFVIALPLYTKNVMLIGQRKQVGRNLNFFALP